MANIIEEGVLQGEHLAKTNEYLGAPATALAFLHPVEAMSGVVSGVYESLVPESARVAVTETLAAPATHAAIEYPIGFLPFLARDVVRAFIG